MKLLWSVFLLGSGLGLAPTAGNEPSIIGAWECELYVDATGETHPFTLTLEQAADGLKGTIAGERGTTELESLKYENGKLTFSIEVPEAGDPISFEITWVDEGKLKGSAGNYSFLGQVKGEKKAR